MSGPLVLYIDEVKSYFHDFSEALLTGDTIVSATVTVTPTGPGVGTPIIQSPQVRTLLTGDTATVDTDYVVTCLAVTAAGETLQKDGPLQVLE